MDEITKDNWLQFAKDNYDNTSLDKDVELEEFSFTIQKK